MTPPGRMAVGAYGAPVTGPGAGRASGAGNGGSARAEFWARPTEATSVKSRIRFWIRKFPRRLKI